MRTCLPVKRFVCCQRQKKVLFRYNGEHYMQKPHKIDIKKQAAPKKISRFGIRRKFALFVCSLMLLVACVIAGLGYFWAHNFLIMDESQHYLETAGILGTAISNMINEKINSLRTYVADREWIDLILKTNAAYENSEANTIQQKMLAVDRQWRTSPSDSALIQKYLTRDASQKIKDIVKNRDDLFEFFITDRFGGIAALSNKTTDFYQADERWWQKAFNRGIGSNFVGSIEFDESAGILSLPVAVPIKDRSGNVIGAAKAVIGIEKFFEPLKKFRIGAMGHAVLLNDKADIVYHEGIKPLSMKFCDQKTFRKLLQKKWGIIGNSHIHSVKLFINLVRLNNRHFSEDNRLYIAIGQDFDEVTRPLHTLAFRIIVLTVSLMLLIIGLALRYAKAFIEPLRSLKKAMTHIAAGNLDYKMDIATNDEIEDLALSFQSMTEELKKTTISRDALLEEIKEREKLEAEVKDSQKMLKKQAGQLQQSLQEALESRSIMVSMLEDNTEIRETLEANFEKLRETQNMLVQAEKLASLGRLIADMAHEVNNPLMIISGRAQLSMMEDVKNKDLRESLQIITDQCERAKSIIQRLLTFSKPSKGELKAIDINIPIQFVVQLLEHQFSLSNITFTKDYASGLPPVNIDEKQMHEVFMNLLKNAAESMPEGGMITITTKLRENDIQIDIADTGRGISSEDMQKLFEPFFTTKEKGTGLGLSVCYGIIKSHGGSLAYTSTPDKGTKATILLPASGAKS